VVGWGVEYCRNFMVAIFAGVSSPIIAPFAIATLEGAIWNRPAHTALNAPFVRSRFIISSVLDSSFLPNTSQRDTEIILPTTHHSTAQRTAHMSEWVQAGARRGCESRRTDPYSLSPPPSEYSEPQFPYQPTNQPTDTATKPQPPSHRHKCRSG
jgi:hypothetical protein